jgi:hypothetical protein
VATSGSTLSLNFIVKFFVFGLQRLRFCCVFAWVEIKAKSKQRLRRVIACVLPF